MNRFSLPNLGIGVGLRTRHYAHILEHRPRVDWFEVISENYLQTQGRPLYYLDRVAEHYPIVLHGVGMSIGSTAPLDRAYLRGGTRTICAGQGSQARTRTTCCRCPTRKKRCST
jgi:uncharacterized protein (UPF0276 family)